MKKWLDQYKNGGNINSLNRKVTCSNCGWSWKLSDGGLDPMTCHKCGGDIKMQNGGEPLDEYQYKGEYKGQIPSGVGNPVMDRGNFSNPGLNKNQLKNINQNLKNKVDAEKRQEIENYKAAELFHKHNPVAQLLGTRSTPVGTIKPTAREIAYGAGAGINEFYDVPGIGIANDFVNPLSLVSKGIISPWLQAPLQAEQSDSYLPYAGAALSTALTVPMVRPASIAAKTVLNPANIYRGALGAGEYLTTQTPLKNTWKLNPYAFNPNPEAYYRLVGEKGLDDIIESGVIRNKPGSKYVGEYPTFKKGIPLDRRYANPVMEHANYKGPYMVESTGNKMVQNVWAGTAPDKNIFIPRRELTINNPGVKFYKEDWLRGYKEVPKPKVFSEGQPYEGAPHIYQDMYPINGRYQPRTVITDAGVKNEILGLEPTPVVPTNAIEYPVTPNKFLNQTYDDFGRMEPGVVTYTYRDMPPGTNTYTSTLPSYASSAKPFIFNQERFNEAKGFLDRYQHLKKLKAEGLIAKDADILKYARSEEGVNDITKRAIEKANTKYRGVYPDLNKYNLTGESYGSGVEITEDILKSTTEAMKNAGVDITNPVAVGEYMSTHIPLNTFGYRSGVSKYSMPRDWDVLFTESQPSSIYGSHQYEMKLPFNFEQGNYKDWYSTFIKNNAKKGINELERNTKRSDWINGNIPYQSELYPGMPYFGGNNDVYAGPKGFKIFDSGRFLSKEEVENLSKKLVLPKKFGGPIITNRGQWDYPGQTTIIPSNQITMQGVPYPVVGVDNTGHTKMMQPGMDYTFPGQYVTEYPMMQGGGQMSIQDIKNAYKTAAYNYNNRIFPKETLQKRQAAYNTINPTDYTDLRNYGRWLSDEQRDVYSDPRSEEAWKFYLGLNKPEDLRYLRKSKYRPTINATQKNYYSVDPDLEQDLFNAYKDKVELNKTLQTDESELETPLSGDSGVSMLGRFGVSRGQDENGDYLSYYDKYDLKDFAQKRTKGVPYSIYGRIYYPKKEQGGEMIKRADGSYSRPGLWDNIRANRGSGKEPTKEMLEQERKIRSKYEQGGVVLNTGGEKHRIYVKSTNRGEGAKGHIMVNHPTMDKGMWDTIDLTEKAGATTIAQGVAATKKWHRENPYKKQDGGEQNRFNTNLKGNMLESFNYHSKLFPGLVNDTFDYDTRGLYKELYNTYNGDLNAITQALTPNSPTEHVGIDRYKKPNHPTFSNESKYSIPIIRPGGKWGHNEEENYDYFKARKRNIKNMNNSDGSPFNYFKRAEDYNQDGIPDVKLFFRNQLVFKNGGYVVRRSHDRKGKTHVVIGPDGTKKYFGDPNMGERGKSKYGKEAFYARHKSNLAKNPYFRAYARATWEEGGETYAIGGQSTLNPIVKKDNRNWLDYLKN